jgi:hypothetical protein
MAGFLYFLEHHTRPVTLKDVRAWGLGYAFEKPPQSGVCQNKTPTGKAGSFFGDADRHTSGGVTMNMEAQVWRKMPRPGQQDVYIGYYKDSPPGPEDLVRAAPINGYLLKMRDGKNWMAPIIRAFDKPTETMVSSVPSSIELNENGDFVPGKALPEFSYLVDVVDKYVCAMQSERLTNVFEAMTISELCRDAKTLLQANYVIDSPEIQVLNLWHVQSDYCPEANATILSAIDFQTYNEWEQTSKKKTPSHAAAVG